MIIMCRAWGHWNLFFVTHSIGEQFATRRHKFLRANNVIIGDVCCFRVAADSHDGMSDRSVRRLFFFSVVDYSKLCSSHARRLLFFVAGARAQIKNSPQRSLSLIGIKCAGIFRKRFTSLWSRAHNNKQNKSNIHYFSLLISNKFIVYLLLFSIFHSYSYLIHNSKYVAIKLSPMRFALNKCQWLKWLNYDFDAWWRWVI